MRPELRLGSVRRRAQALLSVFDDPALEVDLLLQGLLGLERSWIHGHPEATLSEQEVAALEAACRRRLAHEPIQYILGRCTFWGLSIQVGPGCLVPRPETEYLIQAALEVFSGGLFMDWGCGSGCIAAAILKERPQSRAVLVEKNPQSLNWAQKNLAALDLSDRAALVSSDHPRDLPPMELDMIVSNPPYIPSGWIEGLMAEVRDYEPLMALDGGADGLEPYRWLFELGQRTLKAGAFLCVEFGGNHQTEALRRLAPEGYQEQALIRDCSGDDRVLVWRYGGCC